MAFSDKRKAFIDYVKTATSYTAAKVIWLDQNMPRPDRPYIGLKMTNFVNVGREYITTPNTDGASKIYRHKEFTLNIHCYGDGTTDPIEVALNIEHAQDKEALKAILEAQQIAVVDTLMGATDTSVKLDTIFESRASLDLKMRMPFETTDSGQGVIEAITVEGDAKDENGSLIKEVDFEI